MKMTANGGSTAEREVRHDAQGRPLVQCVCGAWIRLTVSVDELDSEYIQHMEHQKKILEEKGLPTSLEQDRRETPVGGSRDAKPGFRGVVVTTE